MGQKVVRGTCKRVRASSLSGRRRILPGGLHKSRGKGGGGEEARQVCAAMAVQEHVAAVWHASQVCASLLHVPWLAGTRTHIHMRTHARLDDHSGHFREFWCTRALQGVSGTVKDKGSVRRTVPFMAQAVKQVRVHVAPVSFSAHARVVFMPCGSTELHPSRAWDVRASVVCIWALGAILKCKARRLRRMSRGYPRFSSWSVMSPS